MDPAAWQTQLTFSPHGPHGDVRRFHSVTGQGGGDDADDVGFRGPQRDQTAPSPPIVIGGCGCWTVATIASRPKTS